MDGIPKATRYDSLFEDKEGGVTVAIVASTNKGKTELAKSVIRQNNKHFDMMYLFSSKISSKQYKNYFFPSCIKNLDTSNKKALANELENLCNQVVRFNAELEIEKKNPLKCLAVIDDLSELLKPVSILNRVRHSKVSLLILAHNISDFDLVQRSQITHWLLNQTLVLNVQTFKPIQLHFQTFRTSRPHDSVKYEYMLWKDNIPSSVYAVKVEEDDRELNKSYFVSRGQFSFEIQRIRRFISDMKKQSIQDRDSTLFQ